MPNTYVPKPAVDNQAAAQPHYGMRGTHNWTESELPRGYRDGVRMLWPNGRATLTAMLAKAKKTRETQSHYSWFEKKKGQKSTSVSSLGGATTVARGEIVTIGVPDAYKNAIRAGHEVLLRTSTNHAADVVVKIVEVERTTTPVARCVVRTLTGDITNADRFMIIGNLNPEASIRPAAISYNGYERDNYQQIFRHALSISRTDLRNKHRIGEVYKDAKTDAWQDHAEEQEGAILWGEKSIEMGDNGMAERSTGGFIPFIRQYAPDNYIDCARIAGTTGQSFVDDFGLELLEEGLIKRSFDWSEQSEKFAFVGNGVLSSCQALVRGNSTYQIVHNEQAFGINVSKFITPYGIWNLHRYTPFNLEPSLQRSILAFEMDQLEIRYTDDFHFEKDEHFGKGGGSGLDGLVEGFLSELGLAFYFLERAIYAYNFGLDSLL